MEGYRVSILKKERRARSSPFSSSTFFTPTHNNNGDLEEMSE